LDFITFANLWINSNYPKTKVSDQIENEISHIPLKQIYSSFSEMASRSDSK